MGRSESDGYTVRKPEPAGLTAVMLSAAAIEEAGTPPRPPMGTVRVSPAATAPTAWTTPSTVMPLARVSAKRAGVSAT